MLLLQKKKKLKTKKYDIVYRSSFVFKYTRFSRWYTHSNLGVLLHTVLPFFVFICYESSEELRSISLNVSSLSFRDDNFEFLNFRNIVSVSERTIPTPGIPIAQNFDLIIFKLSGFPVIHLKWPNSFFCFQMGYATDQFFKELAL